MKAHYFILTIAMMLCLLFISCGEKEIPKPEFSYALKKIDLDHNSINSNYSERTYFVSYENDLALTLRIREPLTEERNVLRPKLQYFDAQTNEVVTHPIASYFGDEFSSIIINYVSTPDGGYFLQSHEYALFLPEHSYIGFTKYDSGGNPLFFVPAETYPTFKKADIEGAKDISNRIIEHSIADADGYIYLHCLMETDTNLSIIDPETKFVIDRFYYDENITVISPDGEFVCALYAEDGNVPNNFVFFRDKDGKVKLMADRYTTKPKIYGIDIENAKLTEPENLNFEHDTNPVYFDAAGNPYYMNTFGLFSVTFDEAGNQVDTMLFDWASIGISRDIISALIIKNDSFITIKIQEENNTPEYFIIHKVKTSELPERKTIKVAVDGSKSTIAASYIVKALSRFNRGSETHRAELVSYATTEGGLTASQKLARDISAGNIPDVIVFNGNLSYELLKKKLKFADLSGFIDNDKEFGRDQLIPCLYTAYETKSGELPYIATLYYNSTISIDESITGKMDSWTVSDMVRINASLADDEYFMARRFDDRVTEANALLKDLLPGMMGEFIDYDKKSCDFTGLSELLELCMNAKLLNIKDLDIQDQQSAKVAVEYNNFTRIYDYFKYKVLGIQNKTNIGFPGTRNPKNGSLITSSAGFGVMKKSKEQEACWELIKEVYRVLDSQWENIDRVKAIYFPHSLLPTTWHDIDELNKFSEKVFFRISDSGDVGLNRIKYDPMLAPNQTMLVFNGDDAQYLYDSIENYSRVAVKDPEAKAIILEEASYYFSGVKPLDEVVKIIADRIETKISE